MMTKQEMLDAKVRRAHAKRYPDGCHATWATMCEACCRRVGGMFDVHPEVRAFHHLVGVRHTLEANVREGEQAITKLQSGLTEDAFYAMEWAMSKMESIAKRHVALTLLEMLKEYGLDKTLRYAQEQALRGARWPEHSTSPTSNVMKEAQTAAWAEFAVRELESRS